MKKMFRFLMPVLVMTLTVSASKRIVVDLSRQRACAYEGSRTVFCGNISSGKPGHRTPTGNFRVLEKDIDHVSSKYPEPNGGAKMHYMLRVTASGIAMHLGHVPNYPASHGCIRMQNGFAQRMYRWASVGTPIRITGHPPRRVNRSSNTTYGTYEGSTNPNDTLAALMGMRSSASTSPRRTAVRQSTSTRNRSVRRRRRKRHADPLEVMQSN